MESIYSRKRIKIKKRSKKEKLKLIINALVFIIIISIYLYIKAAYPIFTSTCKSKARSMAINCVNEEIAKQINKYTYDDLVNIEENEVGEITLIQAKVNTINDIVSNITKDIQRSIDSSDTGIVYINLGKISGFTILSYIGPTFKIELERAGKINTNIKSEFESVGINQTIHRIYLEVKCRMSILTPIETVYEDIDTSVILAESVIIGKVPETYYFYDDINTDRVLDAQ